MENKTYKDKLKNIIRQLPWLLRYRKFCDSQSGK